MILYIVDTSLTPVKEKRFDSYQTLVSYLEQVSIRAYNQNRKQRMIMLEELGHPPDNSQAVAFVNSMAEKFDMGVVRDGRRVRCDIPRIVLYQSDEFGN